MRMFSELGSISSSNMREVGSKVYYVGNGGYDVGGRICQSS